VIKDEKDLKPWERRFIQYYIETGKVAESYNRARNNRFDLTDPKSYNSCTAAASQCLRKIKVPLADIMRAHGITEDLITEKILEGLEAMKQINSWRSGIPDLNLRHKYLELATKLMGLLNNSVNVNLKTSSTVGVVVLPPQEKDLNKWSEDVKNIKDQITISIADVKKDE
jgi:hypothetical protein